MHTLHLTAIEDGNELLRVRAVREAMRLLGVDAKAHHADAKIMEAREDGVALLGVSDDAKMIAEVAAGLEMNGCEAVIDYAEADAEAVAALDGISEEEALSPEEVFAQRSPEPEAEAEPAPSLESAGEVAHDSTKEHPSFSTEGYETAIALLAAQEGDPLKAAAHACTLGRTTGDNDLYLESINALIVVFPWIGPMLVSNGLITPDEAGA